MRKVKDFPLELQQAMLKGVIDLEAGRLKKADEHKTYTPPNGCNTAHTSTVGYVHCKHKADVLVFQHGNCDFYGATRSELDYTDVNISLILDLTNTGWTKAAPPSNKINAPYGSGEYITALAEKLNKAMVFPPAPEPRPHLKIDWPDFKTLVGAGTEFWETLLTNLPDGDIVVCCTGGHGRTGTALSALYMCAKKAGVVEAVSHVREIYCKSAVETADQIAYLIELQKVWRPDLPIADKPTSKTGK